MGLTIANYVANERLEAEFAGVLLELALGLATEERRYSDIGSNPALPLSPIDSGSMIPTLYEKPHTSFNPRASARLTQRGTKK